MTTTTHEQAEKNAAAYISLQAKIAELNEQLYKETLEVLFLDMVNAAGPDDTKAPGPCTLFDERGEQVALSGGAGF